MTDPAGNSEFCFLKILNVSRGDTEGNIEVEWNKTHSQNSRRVSH